jgi:Protein of unknown function (DUF2752)
MTAELPNARFGSRQARACWFALFAALSILFLARLLKPSPSGVGTHEQLHLPACPFFRLTGWPCPSCGFTTSFAHAARGDWLQALTTQPFGLLLFGLTLMTIPVCLVLLIRRQPPSEWLSPRLVRIVRPALLAAFVLAWIYKAISMRGR